jgi:magnesium transporter
MNMPQDASTSLHDPSTPAIARLVDTAGRDGPATPRDVAGQLQSGGFFWLDLEDPGGDELAKFSQSLSLPAGTIESVAHAPARSSFALLADSVLAVLPAAVETKPTEWLEANYVTIVFTEHFLFTVHAAPCVPRQHARHQYRAADEAARADQARVLFLVLDVLLGSFRSQLLSLDDRLDEIQLGMLRGATPPKVHHELIQILGILTDSIQELGWYSLDLDEAAEQVDRLPGIGPGAQQHLDRHRRRVARLSENGKDIRAEAKDALSHYSDIIAGRQAQVINSLTIVATVFLPLSFLTGYFGMNFRILTADAQNTLWQFILLGLLLMIASAALALLFIHRLERRLKAGRIGQ